jgi:site-specific DNA recombinase
LIEKVRRAISRLIDAYGEGLVEKGEFEPRIREARERLARLKGEAVAAAKRESEEADFAAAVEQLEAFARRVGDGLREADWETRRAVLRALIKHVEVGKEAIRVVYKVNPDPFDQGPERGRSQGCWRGGLTPPGERVPALRL